MLWHFDCSCEKCVFCLNFRGKKKQKQNVARNVVVCTIEMVLWYLRESDSLINSAQTQPNTGEEVQVARGAHIVGITRLYKICLPCFQHRA